MNGLNFFMQVPKTNFSKTLYEKEKSSETPNLEIVHSKSTVNKDNSLNQVVCQKPSQEKSIVEINRLRSETIRLSNISATGLGHGRKHKILLKKEEYSLKRKISNGECHKRTKKKEEDIFMGYI